MNTINDYIGIPYKRLDCYALVSKVSFELFNIALPSVDDYAHDPLKVVRSELQTSKWQEIDGPRSGAIAVLGEFMGDAKHVGICIDERNILHTCYAFGSIIQNLVQLRQTGYTHLRYYILAVNDG